MPHATGDHTYTSTFCKPRPLPPPQLYASSTLPLSPCPPPPPPPPPLPPPRPHSRAPVHLACRFRFHETADTSFTCPIDQMVLAAHGASGRRDDWIDVSACVDLLTLTTDSQRQFFHQQRVEGRSACPLVSSSRIHGRCCALRAISCSHVLCRVFLFRNINAPQCIEGSILEGDM